jgi:hypothetical protein
VLEKLQKTDSDTLELIDKVKEFLFSINVRVDDERAWEIFKGVFVIPFEMLVAKNPEIKYQGAGRHLRLKSHANQRLVVRGLGKFELKAVSSKKDERKKASIKFIPGEGLRKTIEERIVVVQDVK